MDFKKCREVYGYKSIAEVEEEFDMKFPMKSVVGMKNVGDMVDVILEADE